ncbi:nucleoside phosphorylase [Lacticaseibacillus yichunensis]|uniref:Uridine phosphorylase n=1 Tax=Lacticaseibacillus yichunensis TaxID=2486015 RepID=A0ABW4CM95_9LACO|nr:nucleoside phosphorylase [Lacticaseibacillus yichunensis]
MTENRFLPLGFPGRAKAVIEPFRDEGFNFPAKFVFAFVGEDTIAAMCQQYSAQQLAVFETVSNTFPIWTLEVAGEKIGLCRAPLGAPAATQLLEFVIAYGAHEIVAVGSCGTLTAREEGALLLVREALRDEGTSYHYLPAAPSIAFEAGFGERVAAQLLALGSPVERVKTWTTDAFFRETPAQIERALELGVTVVEMEAAALAACARYRNVRFAELLFTGDSLADPSHHDARTFGLAAREVATRLALQALAQV